MVQRRLFAVGKQTLSSVVKHSVATVAWQLAFIPERCRVCSQCKLLLNVIHALRRHHAPVEAPNKDSPRALPLVNRIGIHFLAQYWLMPTVISVLFFLWFANSFFEVAMIPFNIPPSIEQLARTWFIDVTGPGVTLTIVPSLWRRTFSYAKINDGNLRWKKSPHQRHLYLFSSFL